MQNWVNNFKTVEDEQIKFAIMTANNHYAAVSEDSKLRQSIRTVALKETKLLDSIGMAQMEQQIQKRVIEITKRNQDELAEETGIQSSLTEDDMKQYLEQVIREVKMQKTGPGKTNNGNA